MKPLIEIIVNKSWETEPFLSAMVNNKLRPTKLPFPEIINAPKDNSYRSSKVRAMFELSRTTVIVRCIEDIMNPEVNPSSSEEKYRVLLERIAKDNPRFIISVSTAESAPDIQLPSESNNGSVFIGGTFYMFDAHSYDPDSGSNLIVDEFQKNNVGGEIYELMDDEFKTAVDKKLAPSRNAPANQLECVANQSYVSIGVVNITNYKAYEEADPAAYKAFVAKYKQPLIAATIETTHGIVKMSAKTIPTLFVSPITDRYEHFNQDVTDIQNYLSAFNAGIAVAELLVRMDAQKSLFSTAT
jgi:hypothetical protein